VRYSVCDVVKTSSGKTKTKCKTLAVKTETKMLALLVNIDCCNVIIIINIMFNSLSHKLLNKISSLSQCLCQNYLA